MRRLAALTLASFVTLAPVALPAATGAGAACAAGTPHAGLVVDTGSRVLELCVELDATSVTGLHLIELAASQHGLQYGFGLGGQAVCRLDGTGPAGEDCFSEYPDFWGYWRGDGAGSWTWSGTGPASASVHAGELDGWVWGTGDTGSSHDAPPTVSITDVCVPEPSPDPPATSAPTTSTPAPRPSGEPSEPPRSSAPSPSAFAAPPSSGAGTHSPEPSRSPDDPPTTTRPRSSSAGSVPGEIFAAGPTDPGPGAGAPIGLLAAIGLAAALGLGGWLRLRSARDEGAR
jgi:hypothetical protein